MKKKQYTKPDQRGARHMKNYNGLHWFAVE